MREKLIVSVDIHSIKRTLKFAFTGRVAAVGVACDWFAQENEPMDDDFDMYRPHGLCATGCGHPATEVFPLYKGQYRFDFRCVCCAALGRLERAHETLARTMKRIPELEKAALKAQQECGGGDTV